MKAFDDALQAASSGTQLASFVDRSEGGKIHIEASLGKAAYLQEQKKDYALSIEVLNNAVAAAPSNIPVLIEKSKVGPTLAAFPHHLRLSWPSATGRAL